MNNDPRARRGRRDDDRFRERDPARKSCSVSARLVGLARLLAFTAVEEAAGLLFDDIEKIWGREDVGFVGDAAMSFADRYSTRSAGRGGGARQRQRRYDSGYRAVNPLFTIGTHAPDRRKAGTLSAGRRPLLLATSLFPCQPVKSYVEGAGGGPERCGH